jgi:hypothetical protein
MLDGAKTKQTTISARVDTTMVTNPLANPAGEFHGRLLMMGLSACSIGLFSRPAVTTKG